MKHDENHPRSPFCWAPKRAGRRSLLLLEAHEQWSVLGLCLTADDLARALGGLTERIDSDKLDLMVLAMRWMKQDAPVCRALQARLDELSKDWLVQTAGCSDGARLWALWEAGCGKDCAPSIYWALLSNAGTPAGLRRRLYRELGARYMVPMNDMDSDTWRPQMVAEVIRMSGEMLVALREAQERGQELSAALQVESALRRQSQRRVQELEHQLAEATRPDACPLIPLAPVPTRLGSAKG